MLCCAGTGISFRGSILIQILRQSIILFYESARRKSSVPLNAAASRASIHGQNELANAIQTERLRVESPRSLRAATAVQRKTRLTKSALHNQFFELLTQIAPPRCLWTQSPAIIV